MVSVAARRSRSPNSPSRIWAGLRRINRKAPPPDVSRDAASTSSWQGVLGAPELSDEGIYAGTPARVADAAAVGARRRICPSAPKTGRRVTAPRQLVDERVLDRPSSRPRKVCRRRSVVSARWTIELCRSSPVCRRFRRVGVAGRVAACGRRHGDALAKCCCPRPRRAVDRCLLPAKCNSPGTASTIEDDAAALACAGFPTDGGASFGE